MSAVTAESRRPRRSARKTLHRVALNLAGLVVFVVMIFPVYWMVSTSFKQGDEILSFTPQFIPTNPTLQNFRDAINRELFWSSVRNSLIVTYMTFVLPFCVWTLRGFLLGIPKDLEEAAMVDGSTRLGVFVKILLPLMAPGLVATSVFAFITTWNEYIFARVLLNDQSKQTITVWLSYFYGTSRHTDWGALMAASTLTAIPVVIFFLLVQRRIAFGLTAGAVRG